MINLDDAAELGMWKFTVWMQRGMEAKLVNQMQHIQALLEEPSQDELLALIEHIARQLRQGEERAP